MLPSELQQTSEAFWADVRNRLVSDRFSAAAIEQGLNSYRKPLIEKGAELWIYHREPEEVASDIAEIIRESSTLTY